MDALNVKNFVIVFCDDCNTNKDLADRMNEGGYKFVDVSQNDLTKNLFFICGDASIFVYNIETKIAYAVNSRDDDVPQEIMNECVHMVKLFLDESGLMDKMDHVLSHLQKQERTS